VRACRPSEEFTEGRYGVAAGGTTAGPASNLETFRGAVWFTAPPNWVERANMARQDEKSQSREEPGHASTSMLPKRLERPALESAFVRVIATSGVIGIGVALGAILTSQKVAGWILGLVIALVSVILSAILWSSRRL
jgi:hypothetical protein